MGMLTVLERELVVVVSSFEAVFCHANINLCFAGCGIVSYAAGGALRDATKNGCVGD